jgi:uncharacterized protein YfiM (DUF2279 family)
MNAVTSREVIHHFSAVAARVAAGQELTVTRHGKPEREALIEKLLSIRMTRSIGKKFERSDAYDD